ncbi:MAG: hypothetical protein AAF225_10700, partial [Pseudomonadota bacterium]
MGLRWVLLKVGIAAGIAAALFVAFTLAVFLVFLIPNEPIAKNLTRSLDAIDDTYTVNGRVVDANTECIGLSIGLYEDPAHEEQSRFWKSVNATSLYGCRPFIAWAVDGKAAESRDYFRYWHGYLLIFRPLMAGLPYHDVRGIIFCLSVVLTGWFLTRTGHDFGFKVGLAFALPLLFLNVLGLITVVTKTVTWWLVVGGAIWLSRPSAPNTKTVPVLRFFVLGCLTAFFDYLTLPMLVLTVPFLIYGLYALRSSSSMILQKPFLAFAFATAAFGMGWIGLWASKIMLAAFVIGPEAISNALSAAADRHPFVVILGQKTPEETRVFTIGVLQDEDLHGRCLRSVANAKRGSTDIGRS